MSSHGHGKRATYMLMVGLISVFYWTDLWVLHSMENTDSAGVQAAASQAPPLPPLGSDANPLRHVLTVILNLGRLLQIVALRTNWGVTSPNSQLPSMAYFRQYLRAPYPPPFESEPRMGFIARGCGWGY
ncbi:hypothetical protein RSAG8_13760, partial [Rhizoctonia solani AG-8 WAC10335]